jgi:hypothetical protein
LDRVVPVVGFILLVAYSVASVVAFADGVEVWFEWPLVGWRVLVVAGAFVLLAMMRLTVLTLPLIFYGAWKVWGLVWWQALLFAVPAVSLGLIMILGGGIAAVWESRSRRHDANR